MPYFDAPKELFYAQNNVFSFPNVLHETPQILPVFFTVSADFLVGTLLFSFANRNVLQQWHLSHLGQNRSNHFWLDSIFVGRCRIWFSNHSCSKMELSNPKKQELEFGILASNSRVFHWLFCVLCGLGTQLFAQTLV